MVPTITSNCVVKESVTRHKDVPTHPVMAQILALVLSTYTATTGPKIEMFVVFYNQFNKSARAYRFWLVAQLLCVGL